ncbi:MAG: Lrp/AsnC family transcriptional regulator [Xanthomonadaceae bacterium]|nr:Lrp/AsnC family transcriptional regulator [Xanthomonadaceae bacterium]
MMDEVDRIIINELQEGFPVCERPYAAAAEKLGLTEAVLIERLGRLLEDGVLSRFGPLIHAEQLGGGLTLAAMQVPAADLERVIEQVNAFPEVAHNYERDHVLNLWFVLATERPEQVGAVIAAIESCTGYPVYNFPKEEEYFLNLRLAV